MYQRNYHRNKLKAANTKYKRPASEEQLQVEKAKSTLKIITPQSEYQLYLQSDHWIALRNRKLLEAEYHCQVCYSDNLLEVHHRTYLRKGHEKLTDLTVLCHTCHSRFHKANRKKYNRSKK